MAKIEMDVSEYDAMKKVEKLLENSLEKERELGLEVSKLKEEKIQALEDAKMKVIKVRKTVRHDMLKVLLPGYDIETNLRHLFNGSRIGDYNINSIPSTMSPTYDSLGYSAHEHHGGHVNVGQRLEKIADAFFGHEWTESWDDGESSITTVGLDDVKKELRLEIENDISEDTKRKLNDADYQIKINGELRNTIESHKEENKKLLERNNELIEDYESLFKNISENEADKKTLQEIQNIVANGYGAFGKGKMLDSIILKF